jgi:hypothetical protein
VALRAGPHTYRRRIEVVPGDGLVEAAMEDHIHHFVVALHHDGILVTAAEATGVRTPWSTCPQGAAGLAALAGTPLAEVPLAERWLDDRASQCVHTVDLAGVAAAHALDEAPLAYEVVVELASFEDRRAALRRDGELVLDWQLEGQRVVGSGPFAGMGLDRRSFSRWLEGRVAPEDREPVVVLRRACTIALGRLMDLDRLAVAADARGADGSCHTYRRGVPEVATRNVGTARDTELDPVGTPIPGGPFLGTST